MQRVSEGIRALLLVAGSALLGMTYCLYLKVEPFPADLVRLVPFAWLAGAVVGGFRAARALQRDRARWPAVLALVLDVPSAVFAAIFSMAVLMGD